MPSFWPLCGLVVVALCRLKCDALIRTRILPVNSIILAASTLTNPPTIAEVIVSEPVKGNDESFDCFDEVVVFAKAGSGGQGSNAFRFGKGRQHTSPFGGSGGDGGSVFFKADPNINTLRKFKFNRSFKAENGQDGDLEYANGMKAADVEVAVPIGTIIYDNQTSAVLGVIQDKYSRVLVTQGGRGGKGNSAQTQRIRGEKVVCTPPEGGQKRWLKLELQLIADVGLIGVPNAGKSTLLDALTNARPKIADYAFTTLVPNLGVCYVQSEYDKAMVLADIPGLIEDAHKGKGLGRGFLRHVERCQALIHVVSACSPDPIHDYLTINKELVLYSDTLATKPQIVVLNKIDTIDNEEELYALAAKLRKAMPHSRMLLISAGGRFGLEELVERMWMFVQKIRQANEVQAAIAAAAAAEAARKASKKKKMGGEINFMDTEPVE